MKIACYTGRHSTDTLSIRLGWAITRLVQRGRFKRVTHMEAIHAEHADGTVDIASASLREGGVRRKQNVPLTPGNWAIIDVPRWSLQASLDLFLLTQGHGYDVRGAIASAVPLFKPSGSRWFCNEWVACPFVQESWQYGPASTAILAITAGGTDVTDQFFGERRKP
jgi:hypothetical protein